MRNTVTIAMGGWSRFRLACGLACAAAVTAYSPLAYADFQSAYKNYREGKFAEASAEFMELAQLGDGASQFNLGVMSVRGEGTEKNPGVGVGWLLASLENGYQGMKPETVAGFKNGLNDEQKAQADAVVSKYGKAAIQMNALPGRFDRTEQCARLTPAFKRQLAQPFYPLNARHDRQDGIVFVQVTIGTDGLARDPHILISVPEKIFDDATIDAVLKSRFTPATRNGEPVESSFMFRLTYYVEEGGELWNMRAIKKVREAAEQGNPDGQYILGLLGTMDRTLNIPVDQARKMILTAAQAGQPQAQYWVAEQMNLARLCGGDDKRKLWLKPAAKEDANAQVELARIYLENPASANIGEIKTLLNAAVATDNAYTLKHAAALYALPPAEALSDKAAALALVPRLKKYDDTLDPHVNEAIAAAYAVNGDFKNAVSQQQLTIKKAEKLYWNTAKMAERLAAYKENRVLTGDVFTVPATTEPLPEVDNEMEDCAKKKDGCGRKGSNRNQTPTGSYIR